MQHTNLFYAVLNNNADTMETESSVIKKSAISHSSNINVFIYACTLHYQIKYMTKLI